MVKADLVIRGGTIVDGQGGDPFEADIAIVDERIARIGVDVGRGREEIDARGLLVTPGFVDVHTHYDGQVTWTDSLVPSTDMVSPPSLSAIAVSASRRAGRRTAKRWSTSWRGWRTFPKR